MKENPTPMAQGTLSRSPIASIIGAVERVATYPVELCEACDFSGRFRHLVFAAKRLRSISWIPGQKVDVQLGTLSYRAYTPMVVDKLSGRLELLVYTHGLGPAARMLAELELRAQVRMFGPRSSTYLTGFVPSVRAFGDETSVALLAAQRTVDSKFSGKGCFLESDAPEPLQAVLAYLGLHDTTIVQRKADGTHLNLVADCLRESLLRVPDQKILLTGRAISIQTVQRALRSAASTKGQIIARAFWADGKVALG
jgi:ferric-chelate reductase (NADPH)